MLIQLRVLVLYYLYEELALPEATKSNATGPAPLVLRKKERQLLVHGESICYIAYK